MEVGVRKCKNDRPGASCCECRVKRVRGRGQVQDGMVVV